MATEGVSVFDELIDMGFERQKAMTAVQTLGENCTLQAAVQYCTQLPSDALRFSPGHRVYCRIPTGWLPGIVMKQNHRLGNGRVVPYQVELDDGRLIFAPIDDDLAIRKCDLPVPRDPEAIPDEEKLPVTIVTGFLGAGKTTLVNYILTQKHGKRIAVIENEFGAVNIDQDLVEENIRTTEDIISMENGCVCCTVRDDLVEALEQMARRKDCLDAVIIETTGLADPGPVCFTFSQEQSVACDYRVDGILCLVDVMHIEQHLDEVRPDGTVNEAVQQVAFADRILINKTDLATRDQINKVKERVHGINSYAELIETNSSEKPPLDKILALSSFSLERATDLVEWTEEPEEEEVCEDPNCTEDHGHSHAHGHGHGAEGEDHGHGHGHGDEKKEDQGHGHGHGHGHGDEKKEDHGHGHGHGHSDEKKEDHGHGHGHDEKKEEDHGHGHGHGDEKKEEDHGHGHGHGHNPAPNECQVEDAPPKKRLKKRHDLSGVSSVGLESVGSVDPGKFNQFIGELLREHGDDVYRSKGVLALSGSENKIVFQGVHEQVDFHPSENEWSDGEERKSKIVFIGRHLNREDLQSQFEACLV